MPVAILVIGIVVGLGYAYLVLKLGTLIHRQIPLLNDPVYVPSTDAAIATMLELAQLKTGEKVVDLGSGDGRLVIAAAQKKCHVVGYEIVPPLVWQSRQKIRQLGLGKYAKIRQGNFWKADLSEVDVVLMYTTASIMPRLAKKFETELKKGTRVVSQRFPFAGWPVQKQQGNIYLYIMK